MNYNIVVTNITFQRDRPKLNVINADFKHAQMMKFRKIGKKVDKYKLFRVRHAHKGYWKTNYNDRFKNTVDFAF